MKKLSKTLLFIGTLFFSSFSVAGQFKDIGTLEVHYSALNSTFISPDVAKQYGITRSKIYALINISILDKAKAGKPAIPAAITGKVKNLLGNTRTLNFKEIKEGKSIYYLAEMPFDQGEKYQFDIDIKAQGNRAGKLTFQQVFYQE